MKTTRKGTAILLAGVLLIPSVAVIGVSATPGEAQACNMNYNVAFMAKRTFGSNIVVKATGSYTKRFCKYDYCTTYKPCKDRRYSMKILDRKPQYDYGRKYNIYRKNKNGKLRYISCSYQFVKHVYGKAQVIVEQKVRNY